MAKKVEKKPARKRKPAAKKVMAKKAAQPRIPRSGVGEKPDN